MHSFNTSLYTSALNHTFLNARERTAQSHWRVNSLNLKATLLHQSWSVEENTVKTKIYINHNIIIPKKILYPFNSYYFTLYHPFFINTTNFFYNNYIIPKNKLVKLSKFFSIHHNQHNIPFISIIPFS